jgi:hypothetical protein
MTAHSAPVLAVGENGGGVVGAGHLSQAEPPAESAARAVAPR